mmetsp:Transcript_18791/g.43846  ORF Transcript_18791/g.43846 Transcript_18791/m.43846 type:complete len:208 (+) Transcript_18791:63-686(+)
MQSMEGSRFRGENRQPEQASICLVWCFERCFKDEQLNRQKHLSKTAEAFGYNFVCYRKAKGALVSLEASVTDVEVVLLADWREVKPLVEGISSMEKQKPGSARKIRLGVLAASKRILRRAQEWASTHQLDGMKVSVLTDAFEDVEDFFRECAGNMSVHENSRASSLSHRSALCDAGPWGDSLPVAEPVLECLASTLKHPYTVLRIQL